MNKNTKTAGKLAGLALAMFAFGFTLVPLYNVFCDITGLNGKTGVVDSSMVANLRVDKDRLITVEFDTNVNSKLPWSFSAAERKMEVRPGELTDAIFYVENLTDHTIVGQAIPSIVPNQASKYFSKTECFCFSNQVLAAGERKGMPVRFVVDPDLPERYSLLTLSYTFFLVSEPADDLGPHQVTSI